LRGTISRTITGKSLHINFLIGTPFVYYSRVLAKSVPRRTVVILKETLAGIMHDVLQNCNIITPIKYFTLINTKAY